MFTKVSEAYSILSDPAKRSNYDNPPPKSEYSSHRGQGSSGHRYRWKNPEFDPNFDHFPNMEK